MTIEANGIPFVAYIPPREGSPKTGIDVRANLADNSIFQNRIKDYARNS
jgi:hypothetical protein